jgi:hypothetical protein
LKLKGTFSFLASSSRLFRVRSLSEAPNYASAIANILKYDHSKGKFTFESCNANISMLVCNCGD